MAKEKEAATRRKSSIFSFGLSSKPVKEKEAYEDNYEKAYEDEEEVSWMPSIVDLLLLLLLL